jgi:TonB family protein
MRPAISRCGEQHPAKGTVKIAVSVNPEGVVTSADVAEAPSPDLGSCVAGFVKKATFAKTANGGSFTYPFVF